MGLVHCKQGDPLSCGEFQKTVRQQPLRRHVDQLVSAQLGPTQDLPLLGCRQGGIEKGRRDARLLQRRHLVLHQGDQRRYHQGQSLQQQGRDLIAETLPAPGGHDPKDVLPRQNRVDQRLLPVPKERKAEALPQNRLLVHDMLL